MDAVKAAITGDVVRAAVGIGAGVGITLWARHEMGKPRKTHPSATSDALTILGAGAAYGVMGSFFSSIMSHNTGGIFPGEPPTKYSAFLLGMAASAALWGAASGYHALTD